MEKISSKDNRKVKEAAKLVTKGGPASFLIEGHHLVEMAAQSGNLLYYFATAEQPYDVPGYEVGEAIIKKLSTSLHPEPIVGVAKLSINRPLQGKRVLLLDRIQDPGNLGTLLRSALSFGFHDVIALEGTCSYFNPKAIQSSQGAIFSLNLLRLSEEEALALLKKNGYTLIGTCLEGASPLEGFVFPAKFALGLGNEGKGMAKSILEQCESNIKISMVGIDSLNVGVAGGIEMHYAAYLNGKDENL